MIHDKYIYSILKYQHSVLLGESLNIGVLIYFPSEDRIVFRYSKRLGRIKAIYDVISERTIKHYLSQIESSINTFDPCELPLFRIDKNNYFDLFVEKNILPRDGSALQFSPSKYASFSTRSIEETIESLTNRFILEIHKGPNTGQSFKESQLSKRFYGYLSNLNFEKINSSNEKFYKDYKVVNETGNEFNFEYAWQNGTLNLLKDISFDLKDSRGLADKAYKNFGLFTDLKNEAVENNFRYDLLISKPSSKDLYREFDHAVNLLSTLEKVKIIFEDEIENYSIKAIEALTIDFDK